MRRYWQPLLLAVVVLSIVLLAVGIVAVSRLDVVAPLWTLRGLIGIVAALLVLAAGVGTLAVSTLLARTLWPHQVQRNLVTLQAFPLRCVLFGVLALLCQVLLLGGTFSGGHRLIFLLFLGWDLIALSQGFPAVAELAGERAGVGAGSRATMLGTALVACGGTVPLVGWLMAAGVILQSVGVSFLPRSLGGAP